MVDEHKQKWDFSQIEEFVFLGADLCCGYEHYEYLVKEMKVVADINLRREEKLLPSSLLGSYLWLPVINNRSPSQHQFEVGAAFIDAVVKREERVFIHCMYGHGRSPALLAGYYVLKQGLSVDAAVKKIKAARAEVHPTLDQMEGLYKLAGEKK